MGHEALVEDLRQKSRERIDLIWREAQARAEEYRVLKREEFEQKKEEVLSQLQDVEEKVAVPILHEAERTALAIEDEAMARLAERLSSLAKEVMGQVRQHEYGTFFAALVSEIPPITWEKVYVNPQDIELARSYFPGAELVDDHSVTGGFVATADDDRYKVVNTLEKRLEKGWPALLPLLFKEILGDRDAASSA